MPLVKNTDTSREFEEGAGQAPQITSAGINAAGKTANAGKTVLRNRSTIIKAGKKAAETGGKALAKAGKFIAQKGGEFLAFLVSNPEISIPLIIILVIVIMIIVALSLSAGWMTKDSNSMSRKEPYLFMTDRDEAYKEIIEDQHPIVLISGKDIIEILISAGINNIDVLNNWLESNFEHH